MKDYSAYVLPTSAGISGIVEASASHWIDRIKTEVQKQSLNGNKKSIIQVTKLIYAEHGFTGFYSGIVPRLITVIPLRFVYWTTMVLTNSKVDSLPKWIQPVIVGCVVGSAQTLLDNPIEVIKIKLMTKSVADKIKLYEHLNINGIKKLYTGFVPSIYRNCIFAMCVSKSIKDLPTDNKILAGATGGFVGCLLTQPFDVFKTELQKYQKVTNKKTSMVNFFYTTFKSDPKKLWAGGSIRCTLGFINMGIGFYVLELILGQLNKQLN
jgi:solute carrier family 25 2-oxodicarboxylate transporter 21